MGKKFSRTFGGGVAGSVLGPAVGIEPITGTAVGAFLGNKSANKKKHHSGKTGAGTAAETVGSDSVAGGTAQVEPVDAFATTRRRAAGTKISEGSDTFSGGTLGG